MVPEVSLRVGWQLGAALRATMGYTFLYASSVARPGGQIDRAINPSQGPAFFTGPPAGPARPVFLGNDADFWVHGLSFGLELSW